MLPPFSITIPAVNASSSNWYYSDMAYRVEHNITGSSAGDVTNYQIKIVIVNGSGTSSGEVYYTTNIMQPDFDDVRFTWYNYSSQTEVPCDYWVEEVNTGVNATFWVEVPEIPQSGTATIYVYYGNSTATTASNATNTFVWFDDFEGTSPLENYDQTGTWQITDVGGSHGKVAEAPHQTGEEVLLKKTTTLKNLAIRGDVYCNEVGTNRYMGVAWRWVDSNNHYWGDVKYDSGGGKARVRRYKEGSTYTWEADATVNDETWYTVEARIYENSIKLYVDGTLKLDITDDNEMTSEGQFGFRCYTYNHYVDNLIVRKYVEPEPSHSNWGTEETQPTTPPPQWSNLGHEGEVSSQNSTFHCYWTSSVGLDHWYFKYRKNEGVWNSYGPYNWSGNPNSGWSNITITLPDGSNKIDYYFIAYDINGNSNQTSIVSFYAYPAPQPLAEKFVGLTTIQGSSLYYNGSVPAVFATYINSTTGNYTVIAFDQQAGKWTKAYEFASAPNVDPHWKPEISIFPNGSLVVFYGYFSAIKYRVSIYSANTESNLTKLITNWSEEREVPNTSPTDLGSSGACYPKAFHFDDRIVLFFRNGSSGSGVWCVMRWLNGSGWNTPKQLIHWKPKSLYLRIFSEGDNIYVGGYKYDANTGDCKDFFLIRSWDKGVYWRNVTGDLLSLPIDADDVTLLNTSVRVIWKLGCKVGNYIYGTGRVTKNFGESNFRQECTIIRVSLLSGSVVWKNITVNGQQFLGETTAPFYDNYYETVSFWGVTASFDTSDFIWNNATKYVQVPLEIEKFQNVTSLNVRGLLRGGIVKAGVEPYEYFGLDVRFDVIGYGRFGNNEVNATGKIWATKFTANYTAKINGIMFAFRQPLTGDKKGAVAIYDENKTLLAEKVNVDFLSGGTREWNYWLYPKRIIPLNQSVQLIAGKTYWLAVWTAEDQFYLKYDAGDVNQTIWMEWESAATGMPSHLEANGTLNGKLSILGAMSFVGFKGIGDIFPPYTLKVGTNVTRGKPLETVKFFVLWKEDENYLDTAKFYWNASGTMQLNGTLSFIGNLTEAWSNFTRTLPNQYGITIAWYMTACDTYGNWGNTSVQYLQLGLFVEVNSSLLVNAVFSVDVDCSFHVPLSYSATVSLLSSRQANYNVKPSFTAIPSFSTDLAWQALNTLAFAADVNFAYETCWTATESLSFDLTPQFLVDINQGWYTPLSLTVNPAFSAATSTVFHLVVPWQCTVQYSSVDTQTSFNVPLSFQVPSTFNLQVSLGALTHFVELAFTVPLSYSLNLATNFIRNFNLNVPVSFSTDLDWNANTNLTFQIPIDVFVAAAKGAAYIVVTSLDIIINLVTGLSVTYGPPFYYGPRPIPTPTPTPVPQPTPTTPTYTLLGVVLIVAVIAGAAVYGSSRRQPKISAGRKAFSSRKLKGLSLPKWLKKKGVKLTRKVESSLTLKLPTWRKSKSELPKWKRKRKGKKAKMKKKKIWD